MIAKEEQEEKAEGEHGGKAGPDESCTSHVIYQALKSGWKTWPPGKRMGYFQEKLKGRNNPGTAKL